jgi:hypothetical protein
MEYTAVDADDIMLDVVLVVRASKAVMTSDFPTVKVAEIAAQCTVTSIVLLIVLYTAVVAIAIHFSHMHVSTIELRASDSTEPDRGSHLRYR